MTTIEIALVGLLIFVLSGLSAGAITQWAKDGIKIAEKSGRLSPAASDWAIRSVAVLVGAVIGIKLAVLFLDAAGTGWLGFAAGVAGGGSIAWIAKEFRQFFVDVRKRLATWFGRGSE